MYSVISCLVPSVPLLMHMRVKHNSRSFFQSFVDRSMCCPVCHVQFSNVTRVVSHLSEPRKRGRRPLSCRDVLMQGLVRQVSSEEQELVRQQSRAQRKAAVRVGHTTPIAHVPAKRPRSGTIVPLPGRASDPRWFDWSSVRPTKRLRGKTRPDAVLAGAIL